jgi:hemolysin III
MTTRISNKRQQRLQRSTSKDGSVHVTDEVFNTWSSGIAAVVSAMGVAWLVWQAWQMDKAWHLLGFSLYGLSLIALFLTSALHHGIDGSEAIERKWLLVDYCVIFLKIAGVLSVFCLVLLRSPLGWTIMAITWALAFIGIAVKVRYPDMPKKQTTMLYVGMGWVAIFIFLPIYRLIGLDGVAGLLVGGLIYTGGSLIHLLEKPNPWPGRFGFHEIWHCCVITAAACHYYVIYNYLLPY